ncbi:MAG: PD-(D/E)XK nuclease family protein [Solirubrobacterales bacterium]
MSVLFSKGGASGLGWSEMEAWMRCEQEWTYKHVHKLSMPQDEAPEALVLGSMVHAGRARWFEQEQSLSVESWQLIKDDVREVGGEQKLPIGEHIEHLALDILDQYIHHWSIRSRPTHLSVEHMLGPVELGGRFTERTARLDDVGMYPELGMQLGIGECKTTNKNVNDVIQQYSYHGQTMLQQILWKLAEQGEAKYGPVSGTVLDIVVKPQKGKKAEFARVPIHFTPEQLERAQTELANALQRRQLFTELGEGLPNRNFTACTRPGAFGRVACPYRNLCQHGQSAASEFVNADGVRLSDMEFEPGTEPWV